VAERLSLQQLEQHNLDLAQRCGAGFVDAYRGPGGLYVVYTSGAFAYMLAQRAHPTPVSIKDLGWSTEFAVSTARGLASGLISATLEDDALYVSEEDSDRAWAAANKKAQSDEPGSGLLERWLRAMPWGQPADALDLQVRAAGIWNKENTELVLPLEESFEPFRRLTYSFKAGKLDSVHTRVDVPGAWKVMEWLDRKLARHFPNVTWRLDDGTQWSLADARPRLEGQAGAKVQLRADLGGSLLVAVPIASQLEGKQYYCLAIICFAPRP
jgi:hypothetical protein